MITARTLLAGGCWSDAGELAVLAGAETEVYLFKNRLSTDARQYKCKGVLWLSPSEPDAPHGAVLADDLCGRNHRALVVAGAFIQRDAVAVIVEIRPVSTNTPVHGVKGRGAGEIRITVTAAGLHAALNAVGINHGAWAAGGIFDCEQIKHD